MLRKYRFLFLSGAVLLAVCMLFLANPGAVPTSAQSAATALATSGAASAPDGDPAHGKYLVQIMGCDGCHGTPKLAADGVIPLAGGREFKLGQLGTFYAFNLTTLQNWSVQDFDKAIRQGIHPRANRILAPIMPYGLFHSISDTDLASIAAYLRSLTPVKNDVPPPQLGPGMANLKSLPAESIPAPQINDSADYGKYLVDTVANCGQCHSIRDPNGALKGRELSGGRRNFGTADSPLYAPPIIGSVLTAEGYDLENFKTTLQIGVRPRGAPLAPAMPWHRFANMTPTDLTAVWNYLQTKKLDSPWPIQTLPPTAAPTQAPTAASTATP